MLQNLIYKLKRLIHGSPALYRLVYGTATFNLDYCQQLLDRRHYVSRFGGMWTDRDDFTALLQARDSSRELGDNDRARLQSWREQGYVLFEQAIDPGRIDRYLDELAALKACAPSPLLITAASAPEPVAFDSQAAASHDSVRVVDDYYFSAASREILLDESIMGFLELVFENPPELNQSLSFEHGSQQDIHQDTAFVRMNSPMKLAAIWVALEDVEPGTGELLYYPGSHRWEDYLFSGHFKHYDEERDGLEQLQDWYRWIHHRAEQEGCELRSFLPRKGDVFIWHAGLAHGGAPIRRDGATRKSLVGHYCPRGVRPLYHYYKPVQRHYHKHRRWRYCSSYYRD